MLVLVIVEEPAESFLIGVFLYLIALKGCSLILMWAMPLGSKEPHDPLAIKPVAEG